MVGGTVIGVTRKADKTHLHVAYCIHNQKHKNSNCPHPDTCCVYTDETKTSDKTKIEISIGDSIWWQNGYCYWTPATKIGLDCDKLRDGVDFDIQLSKIGFSH